MVNFAGILVALAGVFFIIIGARGTQAQAIPGLFSASSTGSTSKTSSTSSVVVNPTGIAV